MSELYKLLEKCFQNHVGELVNDITNVVVAQTQSRLNCLSFQWSIGIDK